MEQLTNLIPPYLTQLFQIVFPWLAFGVAWVTFVHFYAKWIKADDERR